MTDTRFNPEQIQYFANGGKPKASDLRDLALQLIASADIISELRTTVRVLEEEIGAMKKARGVGAIELCAGAPVSYSVDSELRALRVAFAGAVRDRETMATALTIAQASGSALALRVQGFAAPCKCTESVAGPSGYYCARCGHRRAA